jgi:putative addiction module component (TIGR02574 family)
LTDFEAAPNGARCRPIHLEFHVAAGDNSFMSTSLNQLFESALSLPQAERADLAFQLLQTLVPSGEEISTEEFAAELNARVEAHRRGDLPSFSLGETRTIVKERLAQERSK